MVKVVLEGNKKEVEAVRRILEDYTLIKFLYADKPLFSTCGDTRQTLKIQTPDEMWQEDFNLK